MHKRKIQSSKFLLKLILIEVQGTNAGPVNLPPDADRQFGNPIRKAASYSWIEDAVDDGPDPAGGETHLLLQNEPRSGHSVSSSRCIPPAGRWK